MADGARLRSDGLDSEAIAEAWSRVVPKERTALEASQGFTSARIERIIQVAVALCGGVVLVQATFTFLASDATFVPRLVVSLVMLGAFAWMVLASLIGWAAKSAAAMAAVSFPVGLVLLSTFPPIQWMPQGGPWVLLLLNIATAAAVIAFPVFWQIFLAILIPAIYASSAIWMGGITVDNVITTGYQTTFAVVFGLVIVVLAWTLRTLASGVDRAREAAITEYLQATADEAAENERIDIAALMHDSVLAALIAAHRAKIPRQQELASAMAREALTRLANADSPTWEGSDAPVELEWIEEDILARCRNAGVDVTVVRGAPLGKRLPGRAARALSLAATQAVQNSVQHAGGVGLCVEVAGNDSTATVTISDRGGGFEVGHVPGDRLGIRASIFARVAAVGGTASLTSNDAGTTIRLFWPMRASHAPARSLIEAGSEGDA